MARSQQSRREDDDRGGDEAHLVDWCSVRLGLQVKVEEIMEDLCGKGKLLYVCLLDTLVVGWGGAETSEYGGSGRVYGTGAYNEQKNT